MLINRKTLFKSKILKLFKFYVKQKKGQIRSIQYDFFLESYLKLSPYTLIFSCADNIFSVKYKGLKFSKEDLFSSKYVFGNGQATVLKSNDVVYDYIDGYNIWSFNTSSDKTFNLCFTVTSITDSSKFIDELTNVGFNFFFDIPSTDAFQEVYANIFHYTNIIEYNLSLKKILGDSIKWLGNI